MARPKHPLPELEERIGYRFADQSLLERALTHVSAASGEAARIKSYQRLEFLGDRVLGLAVAEMLVLAFPEAEEGELSHRLAELVRRESCAAAATAWEVGPHLRLGAGEVHSGGRRNQAILSDVFESILGAVFLDGGYAAARALVERTLGPMLTLAAPPLRDPKTALQEWAQGLGRPTPIYEVIERTGPDHAPRFRIAARIEGVPEAIGAGASKRAAERDAARAMLLREAIWSEGENV